MVKLTECNYVKPVKKKVPLSQIITTLEKLLKNVLLQFKIKETAHQIMLLWAPVLLLTDSAHNPNLSTDLI